MQEWELITFMKMHLINVVGFTEEKGVVTQMRCKVEDIIIDKGITIFFTIDGVLYAKRIDCVKLKESAERYEEVMETYQEK